MRGNINEHFPYSWSYYIDNCDVQCLSLVKEHRATSPENAGNLDQVKTDALQLRALISVVLMEVEEKCDSQTLDQVCLLSKYLDS